MGSDATAPGKGVGGAGASSSHQQQNQQQPSAIAQAKKLQQAQDEATTQDPVLLASVRQPTRGARVHALPCTIVHDGPAAVSTFFLPKPTGGGNKEEDGMEVDGKDNDDDTSYEAQFRGRNLKGVKAAVPPGMVGFVARESMLPPELADAAPSAAANRYWSLDSEFTAAVLWRHDLPPPMEHGLYQVREWCALAKAIHEDGGEGEGEGGEKKEAAATAE